MIVNDIEDCSNGMKQRTCMYPLCKAIHCAQTEDVLHDPAL